MSTFRQHRYWVEQRPDFKGNRLRDADLRRRRVRGKRGGGREERKAEFGVGKRRERRKKRRGERKGGGGKREKRKGVKSRERNNRMNCTHVRRRREWNVKIKCE